MATTNELKKNLTQTASRRFIDGFANNMVALRYCDRQILEGVFNKKSGDTVTLKVPTQYKGVDLTARTNGEMTSADIEDIETGTISAKVNHFDGLALELNKIEEALETDQLDELLAPASRKLVTRLEDKIFAEAVLGAAGMTGDPTKALASWLDMREVKAYFTKIGAPDMRPNAFLDPDVFTSISSDVKTSFNPDIVGEAIREYYGGRLAGVDTYETMSAFRFDSTAIPVAGALSAETTFAFKELDDAHKCTITLKTAKTVKKGMKFTIAGVFAINQENKQIIEEGGANKLQVFTAVSDSTGAAVTCSPALIGASTEAQQNVSNAGAVDAVVTFIDLKGKKPSVIWTPDAVAVAFIPLQPVSTAEGYTSRQDNVALRVQKQGSVMGNTDTMRFDVMAAIKVIDPLKVVLGFGK